MTNLLEAFADLSTAIINDACLRLEVPYHLAPPGLRPLVPGMRAAGFVRPVRHFGRAEVFFEAIERSEPGEVLVIDNGGRADEGCIGDLVVIEAQAAGLAGVVLWGAVRDTVELRALGLPAFAYGAFPRGPVETRLTEGDALEAAHIGEARMTREHVIFADDDGAVCMPEDRVDDALAVGREIRDRERAQAGMVREGRTLRDQFRFAEYLAKQAADPAHTFSRHVKDLGGAIGE